MNPLLETWTTPFGLPPFADISIEDFEPAFEAALAADRAGIASIVDNPEAPTFANTIDALERSSALFDKVCGVFFNLTGADTNDALEALQRTISPRLAAHEAEILTNAELFARVKAVVADQARFGLTPEQQRVLTLWHRRFVRSGAALGDADRARMKAVVERLAVLETLFGQNVLADEKSWEMPLGADDLDGLPADLIAAAAQAAQTRGHSGHVITLSRSLVVPFLQFSTRRDLREQAFRAWTSRGANGNANDNRAIVQEVLSLREERARLLGYPNFAAYKLEKEMARTPEAVRGLLMAVWEPARARAQADAAVLTDMLRADGVNGALEPWDWRFYSARRQAAEYDFDDATLKPYLSLEAVRAAAFDVAGRLFGLSFHPVTVDLYHPDARAWEVSRAGRHMGVFIGDYFARPSKHSGAWCSTFRRQSRLDGEVRPIVVNVCNFAKAPEGAPSLLTYDDARTLFHEMGHALHSLLSDVVYGSVSGTAVAGDFVELPSQLYEHWFEVPEVLGEHARHVETGEPLPADLIDRLIAARTYGQGFATVEYIASALVDLDFHAGPAPADPLASEAETLARIGMPHAIVMRHATPHFQHVFAGESYASGYYSYMWSEVMDADAFAAFREAGNIFDPDTARRLVDCVLSTGGSRDPAELYEAFRGRMPGVEALLEQRGLAVL